MATTTSIVPLRCPVAGCGAGTGLHVNAPPKDLKRHLQFRSHVEASLGLLSASLFGGAPTRVDLCQCGSPPLASFAVCVESAVKSDRNAQIAEFFKGITVRFCQNRTCLAPVEATPALLRAIDAAQERLRTDVYNTNGTRKKKRHLRGDQAVAVAFASAKFSTPGAVYCVFDASDNQLRVQMKRPETTTFHVAHVARMHRWMRHVLHFVPHQHKLWDTHVAVADSGFIDAFVLAKASDVGDVDNAVDRERLHQRIAAGELVLCAGRSDGWLELASVASPSLQSRIALPLAHLQPHSFRRFDAHAQPSLPLLSEGQGVPLSTFDVRMQHYAPCSVVPGSDTVKLEMLCKCGGWFLVAPSQSPRGASEAALAEEQNRGRRILQSLVDVAELEQLSQQALEAAAARQRAIDAIEQAEQLRLQVISLSQRLAEADRAARERTAPGDAELVARIAQLERQLKQKQQVERVATAFDSVPRGAPVALGIVHRESKQQSHTLKSLLVSAVTVADVEKEMREANKSLALYYRRGDVQDMRLCVRATDTNEFVHSKILRKADGSFACVREVSASSLENLLNIELDL